MPQSANPALPAMPEAVTRFAKDFQLPPRAHRRLMGELVRSPDARILALTYMLQRTPVLDAAALRVVLHRLYATCSPARLIRGLERLVVEGVISRREANESEEEILKRTNRHGQWR